MTTIAEQVNVAKAAAALAAGVDAVFASAQATLAEHGVPDGSATRSRRSRSPADRRPGTGGSR